MRWWVQHLFRSCLILILARLSTENNANSMYHGMEASIEKRFSRGLSFRTSYTYSKSIDEAMEHLAAGTTGSFTQNPANVLGERRGPSDFDVRHRFVASYLYE